MKLTKFTHACVRLESDDGRALVIDPGEWSEEAALDGVRDVLVTHEHFDHLDVEFLTRVAADNPRLQQQDRAAFVEMMHGLNLTMPTHVTEALRTNMSGGKTVSQMLAEAAAHVPFMSLPELLTRV